MGKWIFGLLAAVVLGIGFFVMSDKDAQSAKPASNTQQSKLEQKEQLTVGVDPHNHPEYKSNFELYFAHLNSAVLVGKANVDNGGKTLSNEDYKRILNDIRKNLGNIKYDGEKKNELNRVKKLVNQAIQNNAIKGDEIFYEIHQTIHELDKHFNTTYFVDEVPNKQSEASFFIEKSEFDDVYKWLASTKRDLHSDKYDPFRDREEFLVHIAHASYAYSRHFYDLEDDIFMKMKLSELIKLFGKMKNESDSRKYNEYIEQFDAIYDEIQKERRL
ncbi:hypothetical protein [Geobacillus stearothermophilus]|uniref:hypothetical protein n=1 Tax=Geobacillus stearothermophilus TaxID=1422 RepID=UPI002E2430DC|nr:hypothetical protein [Geobacillus stearothermophilus]MED3741427.1 hypothetical protein [Geobacillus stearothermophilus]MED3767750.1 hypothetical protein [Geobacillus stearothermophilus]MED3775362.1 hypothetical protein [Geobacillus stearothermophilus]